MSREKEQSIDYLKKQLVLMLFPLLDSREFLSTNLSIIDSSDLMRLFSLKQL